MFISFSERQRDRFAELSHDRSPIHMDPEFARATPFGRPIVHGVAALLHSLGQWSQGEAIRFRHLRAEFKRPLLHGTQYELKVQPRGEGFLLQIVGEGAPHATFRFEPGQGVSEAPFIRGTHEPLRTHAREWTGSPPTQVPGPKYVLPPHWPELMAEGFGLQREWLPESQLAALAWASYFSGMEYPGDQAVLTGLEFDFQREQSAAPSLLELSLSWDPRFGVLETRGHWTGAGPFVIQAFARGTEASR